MVGLGVAGVRIHDTVDELTIFEDAALQNTFSNEAYLLENAHRRRIPLEHRCFKPHELRACESVGCHCARGSGSNAFAPMCFTKPVAELAGMASDALTGDDAYSSYGRAFHLDCQVNAWAQLIRNG